ncbi:hypothetical protein V1279_006588 [Bradyrhizobium sp. AZCC 1610]|uniref:hypothetical protein n=1 Tax=Bradyrhizobium sp. AZCC 1610 TaxID=3117020 RepID=UPI002FF1216C
MFVVLMVAPPANELNRILSKLFALLAVRDWEQGQTDRGWQGKSAAFGRAHVVGGVESLRGMGNDQAVAPFQIVKETNAPKAIGLRKLAVRRS